MSSQSYQNRFDICNHTCITGGIGKVKETFNVEQVTKAYRGVEV